MGLVAICGAAWALVRHYTYQPPPLLAPMSSRTPPPFDADGGEIPVPDLLQDLGDAAR
jgi:hypothetical protein